MESFEKLIFDNFYFFFGFSVVWSLSLMGWGLWKRKQRGLFSEKARNIAYEEKTASGRSHKSRFSKLGGASNCLRLVITNDELWITPIFPFSAMAAMFDLDHRILLDKICDLSPNSAMFKKSLLISYRDSKDEKHIVEVMPRNMEKFKSILEQRMV